ncbi:IS3 family transposase [uncultured Bacteroides sp.]
MRGLPNAYYLQNFKSIFKFKSALKDYIEYYNE